jgi:membrane-bound inhibitor of C-type lysozyme
MKTFCEIGRHASAIAAPALAFLAAVVACGVSGSCEKVPVGKGHVYKCSEGVVVRVVYSETDETATVRFAGKTYRLKLVPSGSGAKYSDGKVVFWNKGDEALILINGEVVHDGCRLVE